MAAFLTVGYGDYYPTTPAGKAFFIIWAIFGVATMTVSSNKNHFLKCSANSSGQLLISVLGEAYETSYKRVVHKRTVERTLSGLRRERTNSIGRSLTRTSTMASVASSVNGSPAMPDTVTADESPGPASDSALHEEVMGLPYKVSQHIFSAECRRSLTFHRSFWTPSQSFINTCTTLSTRSRSIHPKICANYSNRSASSKSFHRLNARPSWPIHIRARSCS